MFKLVKKLIFGVVTIVILAAIALGAVFITAGVNAKKSAAVSEYEAVELAKQCVNDYENQSLDMSRIIVSDTDKIFHVGRKIVNSYFSYDVELKIDGVEYEVYVNAKTKEVRIKDIDYD